MSQPVSKWFCSDAWMTTRVPFFYLYPFLAGEGRPAPELRHGGGVVPQGRRPGKARGRGG